MALRGPDLGAAEAAPKSALGALLDPVSVEEFLAEYWDRRHLHTPGGGRRSFAHLLRLRDLEALVPDAAAQRALFEQGRTIRLNGVDRRWPPLSALCGQLAAELGHPVEASIYLTPPGSQGSQAHVDMADVIVLQLEGRKHWRLRERRIPGAPMDFGVPVGPVVEEPVLEPGDVLYVPCGLVHEARCEETLSLHVTLNVSVPRAAPAPIAEATPPADVENLGPDSVVTHRDGVTPVTYVSDGKACIRARGVEVSGPLGILPTLDFIRGTPRFAVRDLPGLGSDGSRLVLVRRLVRTGILGAPAEAPAPPLP